MKFYISYDSYIKTIMNQVAFHLLTTHTPHKHTHTHCIIPKKIVYQ